jgi:predicted dehydrogenase
LWVAAVSRHSARQADKPRRENLPALCLSFIWAKAGSIYSASQRGWRIAELLGCQVEREEPLKRQLMSFAECASTGREPRVSGFQATAALELAVEITKRVGSSA